ncbi:hypothetical protein ACSBR2_007055 [Camellia fascicularis]
MGSSLCSSFFHFFFFFLKSCPKTTSFWGATGKGRRQRRPRIRNRGSVVSSSDHGLIVRITYPAKITRVAAVASPARSDIICFTQLQLPRPPFLQL